MRGSEASAAAIPCLRYNDASAAIDWLCNAFGFEKHLVVPGDDGEVAHAQLKLGSAMVMLSSARDDQFGQLYKLPAEVGAVTQSPYIVIHDIDAHYGRAKSAGAEMVIEIKDEDYGGRAYSARDPEGNVWNFGSYDPWAN